MCKHDNLRGNCDNNKFSLFSNKGCTGFKDPSTNNSESLRLTRFLVYPQDFIYYFAAVINIDLS